LSRLVHLNGALSLASFIAGCAASVSSVAPDAGAYNGDRPEDVRPIAQDAAVDIEQVFEDRSISFDASPEDGAVRLDVPQVLQDAVDGSISIRGPRCDTPDFPVEGWDLGKCACIGTQEGRRGICRTGLRESGTDCYARSCSGLRGFARSFCVMSDAARGLFVECADRQFCQDLRALGLRRPAYPLDASCVYGDGTAFVTGDVPEGRCPSGTEQLLCGVGCAPCGPGFAYCWAYSESNPIGACVPSNPPIFMCDAQTDCGPGRVCLVPMNLDLLGRRPRGVCFDEERCRRVAAIAPARFGCR
jgi:hypothetical protein